MSCNQKACLASTTGCGGRISTSSSIKIANEVGFKSALLLIVYKFEFYFKNTKFENNHVIYQGPSMEDEQKLPSSVRKRFTNLITNQKINQKFLVVPDSIWHRAWILPSRMQPPPSLSPNPATYQRVRPGNRPEKRRHLPVSLLYTQPISKNQSKIFQKFFLSAKKH